MVDVLVLALVLQAQPQPPPPAPPPLPVSLERIRRELRRPAGPFEAPEVKVGLPSVFYVMVEEALIDPERLWENGTLVPVYVRPTRNLYQHEFLDAVTPEEFRSTAKHPCCDVVPLLSAAARKIGGAYRKYSESRARREVREAIKAYEAHMQAQRAREAKP